MVKKVIRPSARSRVMIRYRQATETPMDVEPAAARGGPSPPSWHGLLIKIEELPDFKARWGLATVYAEWPEGDLCPVLYLVEVEPRNPIDRAPGSA
jgi:hypothetical protein